MTAASIPVDLFNPGQVFACLGLVELAELLVGETRAAFDWSEPGAERFILGVEAGDDPIAVGLEFLAEAEVSALGHRACSIDSWQVKWPPLTMADEDFPAPPPPKPASLPAVLRARGVALVLSSWAEVDSTGVLGTGRDNAKFWAGLAGYPGVGLLRDALDAARPSMAGARSNPFAVFAPQSSSFRFDWRRDYVPIDIGFSLNSHHKAMQPLGYPLVEVLAAIGMSHARPRRLRKLEYRYGIVGRSDPDQPESSALVPAPVLRAALGVAALPFPTRSFAMNLDWPGQEGQARCITTVHEET